MASAITSTEPSLDLSLGLGLASSSGRAAVKVKPGGGGFLRLGSTTDTQETAMQQQQPLALHEQVRMGRLNTQIGSAGAISKPCTAADRVVMQAQEQRCRARDRGLKKKEARMSLERKKAGTGIQIVNPNPSLVPTAIVGCEENLRRMSRYGKDVQLAAMPRRMNSTSSSSSGISGYRSGSGQDGSRSRSGSSSSSDARCNFNKSVEKSHPQKVASTQAAIGEKLASSVQTSGVITGPTLQKLEGARSVNKPVMVGKESEKMPLVSVTGDGPNGKTITGILYKYSKPGKVSIMCACHGRTFTPEEFVMHAGGTETAHPERLIRMVCS